MEPGAHERAVPGAGHLSGAEARHGPQHRMLCTGRRGAGLRGRAADPLLCGGAWGVPEPAHPDLRYRLPGAWSFPAAAQRHRGERPARGVRPVRHL